MSTMCDLQYFCKTTGFLALECSVQLQDEPYKNLGFYTSLLGSLWTKSEQKSVLAPSVEFVGPYFPFLENDVSSSAFWQDQVLDWI